MVAELKQHIELRGENPLDAVMVGSNLKVYLIASFALQEGVEAVAVEYDLTPAAVHAALTFHFDNEHAIHEARAEDMRELRAMGMRDSSERLAEIRLRHAKKSKNSNDN
jgi:hypothetical protein